MRYFNAETSLFPQTLGSLSAAWQTFSVNWDFMRKEIDQTQFNEEQRVYYCKLNLRLYPKE